MRPKIAFIPDFREDYVPVIKSRVHSLFNLGKVLRVLIIFLFSLYPLFLVSFLLSSVSSSSFLPISLYNRKVETPQSFIEVIPYVPTSDVSSSFSLNLHELSIFGLILINGICTNVHVYVFTSISFNCD